MRSKFDEILPEAKTNLFFGESNDHGTYLSTINLKGTDKVLEQRLVLENIISSTELKDLQIDMILRLSSHHSAGMIEIDLSNHNHGSQLRFGV